MIRTPLSATLLALSGLTAGCLGFVGQTWTAQVHVDSAGNTVANATTGADAVRAQAADDFGCPVDGVVAEQLRKESEDAYHVAACNHRATYVSVTVYGVSTVVPGYEGTSTLVYLRRYLLVSQGDPEVSLAVLRARAEALQIMDHGDKPADIPTTGSRGIAPWIQLSHAASRDLSCPRASILLDVVENYRAPSTFLAEGCGYRGTFVKDSGGDLVISSRVSLTPPGSAAPPAP